MTLPLWEPAPVVLILLDTLLWGTLHMLIAWGGTIIPARVINSDWKLFREFTFEKSLYRFFRVKRWKDRVPDAASWFRTGFAKASFSENSSEYVARFVVETCRGELVHWGVIAVVPLFFLFNPREVWWVHILYALLSNIPFILIQRYNRPRLRKLQIHAQRRTLDSKKV